MTIKNISEEFENKKVLYFPIVSMRSKETGEYNLTSDGNVNRFLTTFYQSKNSKVTMFLPKHLTDASKAFLDRHLENVKKISGTTVDIIYSDDIFGENALATRKHAKDEFMNRYGSKTFDNYDVVVYEPNCFVDYFMNVVEKTYKTVYWCVVSNTTEMKPDFLVDVEKQDLDCVKYSDVTYLCTKTQEDYFANELGEDIRNKIKIHMRFMDPQYFVNDDEFNVDLVNEIMLSCSKNIVYLPFRITHTSYDIKYILDVVKEINEITVLDINVLYTDPSNCKKYVLDDEYKGFCVKANQSNRDDYYTVLSFFSKHNHDYKMIIPYLEDSNSIVHASLFEFEHFEDNYLKYATDNKYNNELILSSRDNLKAALLHFFEEQ